MPTVITPLSPSKLLMLEGLPECRTFEVCIEQKQQSRADFCTQCCWKLMAIGD